MREDKRTPSVSHIAQVRAMSIIVVSINTGERAFEAECELSSAIDIEAGVSLTASSFKSVTHFFSASTASSASQCSFVTYFTLSETRRKYFVQSS